MVVQTETGNVGAHRVTARARQRRAAAIAMASGLVLAIVFGLTGETPPRAKTFAPITQISLARFAAAPVKISSTSSERLAAHFERIGYTLARVRAGDIDVPRIVPDAVPVDLADIQDAKVRKQLFLQMVLPLVLVINDSILQERTRIEDLRLSLSTGALLNVRDRAWLDEKFKEYKVGSGDFGSLLQRIDIVPVSLALAQAAVESGWGTSRFAREGNALFGQWTTEKYEGIVPESREEGKTHKIRAFREPVDAVASYFKNLNTHAAYRDFRKQRAAMRRRQEPLTGIALVEGLEAYSEQGRDYVVLIRQIIETNELAPLDRVSLATGRRSPPRV